MGKAAKFLYLLAGRLKVLGLLDEYSGAAAAYSLRSLSSSTTNVVKVRRSGDDAELDFTASEVSGGTLAAWVVAGGGTEDGFVTTWYDQSGNANNATQTTAANQPKIVSSGTLVTENGKAAILGDGTTTKLQNFTVSLTDDYLISLVSKLYSAGTNMWLGTTSNSGYFRAVESGTSVTIRHNGETGGGDFNVSVGGNQLLHTAQRVSTTMHYAQNGVDNTTTERATQGVTFDISCLFDGFSNQYEIDGTMQEVVIYATDQSANRTGIEANINDYYSIYP